MLFRSTVTNASSHFRFDALFVAELKLFLKGQRWWWYAITGGLIVAQLAGTLEATRLLLAIAWVWPILLLNGLGCREARHDTRQMVFSTPRLMTALVLIFVFFGPKYFSRKPVSELLFQKSHIAHS